MRPQDRVDRGTDQSQPSHQAGETGVSRRAFLTAGATIGAGALAASTPASATTASRQRSGGPRAPPDPTALDHVEARDVRRVDQQAPGPAVDEDLAAIDDDRIVDAVADLGIDATGQQSATGTLQSAAARGEVVKLPPGDYLLASPVQARGSWGIVGTGDSPQDVRLHGQGSMQLIEQRGGTDVRLENFALVNGRDGEVGTELHDGRGGPRGVGLTLLVEDGLMIRDVSHIGVSPREGVSGNHEEFNDQEGSLTVQITDPNGVGVIEGFRKVSPTEISGHAENDAAINSWQQHRGICYVRNSRIDNSGGDGATYVSRSPGGWRFTRCAFRNNYAATLRLGGGQSWARACTIVCDAAADDVNNVLDAAPAPMNPIIWEAGSSDVADGGFTGGLVADCRIVMRSVNGSQGGISIDGSHGGVVIRDTEIVNQTDAPCIAADAPGSSFMNDFRIPANPHDLYLEGLTLAGSGGGPAIDITGRGASTGQQVCVNHPGGVTGLPQSALGCGPVEDPGGTAPDLVTQLLADLDRTQPGDMAPPDVDGAVGTTSGIAAAAQRYATMVALIVMAIALGAVLASAGAGWLLWETVTADW